MISSYNKNLPAQAAFERGLDQVLSFNTGRSDVFFEFLDSGRLQPEAAGVTDMLRGKYAGRTFDAVIALEPPAARVVAANRPFLRGKSIIFIDHSDNLAANPPTDDENDIVLVAETDYQASLREALRISRAERIVVVGGARIPGTNERLERFRRAHSVVAPHIPIETILDRPIEEVISRTAALPPGTMIYYLLMFSDGHGAALTPYEIVRRFAPSATAPVFTLGESLVGSGIVGGTMSSLELTGHAVGEAIMATRRGITPPPGRITRIEAMRTVYDRQQMARWGYEEERLPPGAIVVNRPPPDLISRYRWHLMTIATAATLLIAAAILLVGALHARKSAVAAVVAEEQAALAERVRERTAELEEVNSRLEALSATDSLTGLANRRRFDEALAAEWTRAARSRQPLALVMLDVDHFKKFNDRYGHQAGDDCLKSIATTLRSGAQRPGDLAARYGGEEFVLILPNTDAEHARVLAEMLRKTVAGLGVRHQDSPEGKVTASIGAAITVPIGDSDHGRQELLHLADKALYRAKHAGRNRVEVG